MSETPKGFWGWALVPHADRNMLVFISMLCIVLAIAGLLIPAEDVPFISQVPLAAAVSSFFAALVAVIAAWPLRFLLRRRAGYYSGKDDGK